MKINQSLQDTLYGTIRNLIVDLKLEPGKRINIEDLSEKLGVSRTPVREVLQRLKTEDFVTFIPRIGPVAKELSRKELEDLFAIRERLEVLAAEEVIKRIEGKEILRLAQIVRKFDEMVKKKDGKNVAGLNKKFHKEIYKKSNNPQLEKYLEDISAKIERYMNILSLEEKLQVMKETSKSHGLIFECVKNKKPIEAAESIRGHLDYTRHTLIKILHDKYPGGPF